MGKKEVYSKSKITITLDKKLIKRIDEVKNFPKWKGNRSNLIETILVEYLEAHQ